jgi:endonuclease/exonuclease/phosphatase family metal-dependent hydrolase
MIGNVSGLVLTGFLLLMVSAVLAQSTPESMRVMSYNIRYDTPNDKEDQWSKRKERLAALIRYHQPDLFGTQEALYNQVQDIATMLPQYAWYGLGRDDGKEKGEFSAIFYDKNTFELLDKGTFWLAPDPTKPVKGWDAAIVRICSWVKLRDKQSRREFYYFNTHFDHMGEKARENSSLLIVRKVKEIAGNTPTIVTGDFNANDQSAAYQNVITDSPLRDAKTISATGHYGPDGSFSTFNVSHPLGDRIDYVFVTDHFEVLQHAILTDSQAGKYPSDHLPVIAEIRLKK